jgi:hypothetical protein
MAAAGELVTSPRRNIAMLTFRFFGGRNQQRKFQIPRAIDTPPKSQPVSSSDLILGRRLPRQ